MSSKYIYAGTRSTVLKNTLLTNDQLEVILAGENYEAAYRSLHETFLAPYIARRASTELPAVLEEVITDTKELLQKIAPEPELLDVLWLKYDFYNLQAVIKGERLGWSESDIEQVCFTAGKFTPRTLLTKYQNQQLKFLNPHLHRAAQVSINYQEVSDIALATNLGYLTAIKEIAADHRSQFVKKYTELMIDIFNVQANLRAFTYGQADEAPRAVFVSGGRLHRRDFETPESILAVLLRLGSKADFWQPAIDSYRQTGSYSVLEKACDDLLGRFLRTESRHIFSPAPLFAYFQAKKNNVQLVRTILVGKQTGQSEYDIRQILRERFR